MTQRVLSTLVANRPGVLNRVSGLIRRRGFNIDKLTVGPTADPAVSRMTIVIEVGTAPPNQAVQQLAKLIDVFEAEDITDRPRVEWELMMLRVTAPDHEQPALRRRVAGMGGRIVHDGGRELIVATSGPAHELDALVTTVGGFPVREVARTGVVAMTISTEGSA